MLAPDLAGYDRFVVAMSGGKDSIGALLTLLDAGVSPSRIECHHHDVDGAGPSFMDWPCNTAYCRAVVSSFGIPFHLSWRQGGFLREMLRNDAPSAPVCFEEPDGLVSRSGGIGRSGTRLRFPQVSPNLRQRWCSASLKIDVMDALIRGQDRFLDGRTLVVTGERAEESPARARYAVLEPHRTDTRHGTRRRRHVDHWRAVHGLTEHGVWALLRTHGVVPAPAYRLGWSRLSCIACIFGGADQWASLRHIAPAWFERIAGYEDQFGCTIHRSTNVRARANRGRPYLATLEQPGLAAAALRHEWNEPVRIAPRAWRMPAGAFGNGPGPS